MRIYSCSSVTYAPHGSMPLPMNLLGAFVYFRQMMLGKFEKPKALQDEVILEWLLYN